MQLMNYCKVKYSKQAKTYTIVVPEFQQGLRRITFKFDTGATDTMITVNALFTNSKIAKKAVWFLNRCYSNKEKYASKCLRAASGSKMKGILCSVNDFAFNGLKSFKFYFYLIFSTANPKALLGVDFIRCCDFNCKIGQDIEITKFYNGIYPGMFSIRDKARAIDISELLTILKDIELPKEYKAKAEQTDLQGVIDSLDFESSGDNEEILVDEVDSSDGELATIKSFL